MNKIKTTFNRIKDSMETEQQYAIRNIIRFMIIIFVITIIARGTSAVTLARVEIQNPTRAEIVEAIIGTAEVVAKDTIDVMVPEGLMISEMLVNEGQSVSIGDKLAVFSAAQLEEVFIRETAKLDRLILDLEILERSETPDEFALRSAEISLRRAQEDYNIARTRNDAEVATARREYNTAKGKLSALQDSSAVDNAARELTRAQEDYDIIKAENEASILSAQQEIDTRKAEYDSIDDADIAAKEQARINLQAAQNALDAAIQNSNARQQTALQRVEAAQSALNTAQQDFIRNSGQINPELLAEIERARVAYENAVERSFDAMLAAGRRLEDARLILAQARDNYLNNEQRVLDNEILNSINAATLQLDINSAEENVSKLRDILDNNGVLYSKLSGIVASTGSAGFITDSTPLITFLDGEKGFEAVLTIERADAENIRIGDECNVLTQGRSLFFTPTVIGVITGISNPDENGNVKITISLPDGNWRQGQRVEVQAVTSRQTYHMCIPLSALRSDNSGYFVLVVEQSVSVLGVVNTVSRIPVTVDAFDSQMAAVSGPLDHSSGVIVSSNKIIQTGDRVRIIE